MTDTQTSTRWVSPKAAADYFHISRTTVYRLIHEGSLPVRRFPGRRSFLVNLDEAERNLNAVD